MSPILRSLVPTSIQCPSRSVYSVYYCAIHTEHKFSQTFLQTSRSDSWSRFLHHAPRVKIISCVWRWHTIAYLKVLAKPRPDRAAILFPALHTIVYKGSSGGSPEFLPIRLLAHPGLHSLELHCDRDTGQDVMLSFLKQLAPQLRRIEVSLNPPVAGSQPCRLRTVPKCENLTVFRCRTLPVAYRTLRSLGALPNLHILDVLMTASSWPPGAKCKTIFPALHHLSLITNPPGIEITSFLQLVETRQLRTFSWSADTPFKSSILRHAASLLARQPLLTRFDIRIRDSPEVTLRIALSLWNLLPPSGIHLITVDDVRPLFGLTYMTSFTVHNLPMLFTNRDVEELAVAWPHLRYLELVSEMRPQVTLEGLRPLSLHCSELCRLVVSIDATYRRKRPVRKSFQGILRRHGPRDANLAADSVEMVGVGGGSVCTHLKSINIRLSMVNNPHHVASVISQYFPNVRIVTADVLRPWNKSKRLMKKLNMALCKRSAERWLILDKVTQDLEMAGA